MKERLIFEKSGLVKDENDIKELELWGHDGGEYFWVKNTEIEKEQKDVKRPQEYIKESK